MSHLCTAMFCRRLFLVTVAAAGLLLSACSQAVPTKISVTQAQLEQGLRTHFPKKFPIAGLLQLQMQLPQLQLVPQSNQLQTNLPVELSGSVLRQSVTGQMQVRFGLVYAAKDRSVRAERVEVLALELNDASPAMAEMVQTYGLRVAQQALEGFALYNVPSEELELVESLGLQPGAITVTNQGLDVAIVKTPTPSAQP